MRKMMGMMPRLMLCCCPKISAEKIACEIVKSQLAAHVYSLPVVLTHYPWRDKSSTESEVTLLCVTREDLADELYLTLLDFPLSELPVIVSFPIGDVSKDFQRSLMKL